MTRNENINKFLNDLKNGENIFEVAEANYLDEFLDELKEVGLVYRNGDFLRLTKEGILLTSQGKTYEEFLQPKQEPARSIHVGHNISGNVSQSSLPNNLDNSRNEKYITTHNEHKRETKSYIEIFSWIIGIIAGLCGVYGFYIQFIK